MRRSPTQTKVSPTYTLLSSWSSSCYHACCSDRYIDWWASLPTACVVLEGNWGCRLWRHLSTAVSRGVTGWEAAGEGGVPHWIGSENWVSLFAHHMNVMWPAGFTPEATRTLVRSPQTRSTCCRLLMDNRPQAFLSSYKSGRRAGLVSFCVRDGW